jgi:hypothetical protein
MNFSEQHESDFSAKLEKVYKWYLTNKKIDSKEKQVKLIVLNLRSSFEDDFLTKCYFKEIKTET